MLNVKACLGVITALKFIISNINYTFSEYSSLMLHYDTGPGGGGGGIGTDPSFRRGCVARGRETLPLSRVLDRQK